MFLCRRNRRRPFQTESLESRQMLAAAYLHSLTPRSGVPTDGFGSSHAMSHDYHIVGNPWLEDQPENGFVGEVQIHDAATGARLWTITNPDPDDLYRFGVSVDIAGNWIVVGAVGWGEPPDGYAFREGYSDRSGRAYLYEITGGNVVLRHRLNETFETGWPPAEQYDQFGHTVSIDGNFVVVGAPGAPPVDTADLDPGHAYVYQVDTGVLLHVLQDPDPMGREDFGFSVSASDGKVAITNETQSITGQDDEAGACYVYDMATGALLQTLTAPDDGVPTSTIFGLKVVMADGLIAVSGMHNGIDPSQPATPATFVFDASNGNLLQTHNLVQLEDMDENLVAAAVPLEPGNSAFGNIINAGTGSELADVLPPSSFSAGSAAFSATLSVFENQILVNPLIFPDTVHAVYVYGLNTNAPPTDIILSNNVVPESPLTFLHNSTPPGTNASLAGVQSVGDRILATSATVPQGVRTPVLYDATDNSFVSELINPTPETSDGFGQITALSSSYVAVASTTADGGAGVVHIFDANTGGWLRTLSNPASVNRRYFGQEIAIDGDLIVITSSNGPEGFDSGEAYLFNVTSGDLLGTLSNPTPGTGDEFEASVAIQGNRIVIGAPRVDAGATDSGRAYVYEYNSSSGAISLMLTLNAPSSIVDDHFGNMVAIQGNRIAVGASGSYTGPTNSGKVFLFDSVTGTLVSTVSGDLYGQPARIALENGRLLVSRSTSGALSALPTHVDLFDANTGSWISTINNPAPDTGDVFGHAVFGNGNTFFINSTHEDIDGNDRGLIYASTFEPGAVIGTLSATDPDAGEILTFQLLSDAGGRFALNGTDVVIANGFDLNFEQSPEYDILVLVTDSSGNLMTRQLTIQLTDVPEQEQFFIGTSNDESYVVSYSGVAPTGTATVTVSTNGGPVRSLGVFGMNIGLMFDGQDGNDSIRIVGTSDNDDFRFASTSIFTNNARMSLTDIENCVVAGLSSSTELGFADRYQFDADMPIGLIQLEEVSDGNNSILFDATSVGVSVNLASTLVQYVNSNLSLKLNSSQFFGTLAGGSGDDVLLGSHVDNSIFGNAGNDQIGGRGANDLLAGGPGNDTYLFGIATSQEADSLIELPDEGTDLLSFVSLTTPVSIDLSFSSPQVVHAFRTLRLNEGTDFENVYGGSGNDTLIGNAAGNRLEGRGGNDILNGAGGSDLLLGGLGNDRYDFSDASSAELDRMFEYTNEGTDEVRFAEVTSSVNFRLNTNAIQSVHMNRQAQINVPLNFENLTGSQGPFSAMTGNASNNRIVGVAGVNSMDGLDGDDELVGASGNDALIGGQGSDLLIGGDGTNQYIFADAISFESDNIIAAENSGEDTLVFLFVTSDLSVNLSSTLFQEIHSNRILKLNSGTAIENVTGGSGNDVLIGNDRANIMNGGSGNDILHVGTAPIGLSDTLRGETGNDRVIFHAQPTLTSVFLIEWSGQGTDTLDFAAVNDNVTFWMNSNAIQVPYSNQQVQLNSNVVFDNIVGGTGDDVLYGNSLANMITGNDGNDTLYGRGGDDSVSAGTGNDSLVGDGGSDSLDGGPGDDTYTLGMATTLESDIIVELPNEGTDVLSFLSVTVGLNLDLSTTAVQSVHNNRTLHLSDAQSIEDVLCGSGDDIVWGNSQANTLVGNAGFNLLFGRNGDDILLGGTGIDHLIGMNGSDVMTGGPGNDFYGLGITGPAAELDLVIEAAGEGIDELNFASSPVGINFRLDLSIPQQIRPDQFVQLSDGEAIEDITGSLWDDTFHGNSLANRIKSHNGNDVIHIGAAPFGSTEIAWGGQGDDVYVFHPQPSPTGVFIHELNDQGSDTLDFSAISTDVSVWLNSNAIYSPYTNVTLQLSSSSTLDNVTGGSGNDQFHGNSLANILTGGSGHDLLIGYANRDLLFGGTGADTLIAGSGDDVLIAGTTSSDNSPLQLIALQNAWNSANPYLARVLTIRAGVSPSGVSLQAGITAMNDSPDSDKLTGNDGDNWFLSALDDVISDLGSLINDLL